MGDAGICFEPLVEVRQVMISIELFQQLEDDPRRPTDPLYLPLSAKSGIQRRFPWPDTRPAGARQRRRLPFMHVNLGFCRPGGLGIVSMPGSRLQTRRLR
jgi:hypothetical protein